MINIRLFIQIALALGAAFYLLSCREMQPEAQLETAMKPATNKTAPELAYPGEKGIIKKGVFRGTEINYTEIDGKAVFEGDIILSPEQLEQPGTARTNALTKLNGLWSNNTIPYTIDASITNKEVILAAIAEFESKTQLRFKERNSRANPLPISPLVRQNWVTFKLSRGYSSSIGCIGGEQFVTLPFSATKGAILHELAHTIGMYHEHTRPDRTVYVKINSANMDPADLPNVGKFSDNTTNPLPYRLFDFTSIMMLDSWAYSNNGQPMMTTIDNKTFTVQRDHLSKLDVDGIIAMYSDVFIGREDQIYLGDTTTGRTVVTAGYLPGYKKMFATSEYLFVADKTHLFQLDNKSAYGGNSIWSDPSGKPIQALTYADKNLYALQNGYLTRFTFPWGGGYPTKLGGQLWQGGSAITYAAGYLFIISGDVLYRVSLTGTSSSPIGFGYNGTTELVTLKDKVYALRPDGKLYKIEPLISYGSKQHTNITFAGNAQLASNGKNLLITSGNSLLSLSESGAVKVLSDGWAGTTDLAVINPGSK